MARKASNNSTSFTEASVWGNMKLIDKSGVTHYFAKGIPLDTNNGRLEKHLAGLPDGTEVTVILKVSHRGQKVEIDL